MKDNEGFYFKRFEALLKALRSVERESGAAVVHIRDGNPEHRH